MLTQGRPGFIFVTTNYHQNNLHVTIFWNKHNANTYVKLKWYYDVILYFKFNIFNKNLPLLFHYLALLQLSQERCVRNFKTTLTGNNFWYSLSIFYCMSVYQPIYYDLYVLRRHCYINTYKNNSICSYISEYYSNWVWEWRIACRPKLTMFHVSQLKNWPIAFCFLWI